MGYQTNCGMVACKAPTSAACCLPDESCQIGGSLEDCEALDGTQWLESVPCDPNPCVTQPIEKVSWGEIKAGYR